VADLLPCPFCGGKAERIDIEDGDNVGGSCVTCTTCNASGNVEFGFKENFVSNWNRRAPVADWQPIETAPRDGREILVYDPIVQITFCVRWTGARFPWTLVFGYREFSERSPSHWMPLPAAPVDGGEDA